MATAPTCASAAAPFRALSTVPVGCALAQATVCLIPPRAVGPRAVGWIAEALTARAILGRLATIGVAQPLAQRPLDIARRYRPGVIRGCRLNRCSFLLIIGISGRCAGILALSKCRADYQCDRDCCKLLHG
ncbi:MAG: hypothetical protein GX547_12785 [Phycisphaerae bacterium]|nr:hypothetical protein [Phycisphaerae bacterium]